MPHPSQIDTNSDNYRLLPLAAGIILAHCRSDPLLVENYQFRLETQRVNPAQTAANYHNPLFFAYSCYAWNIHHSLAVAREAKQRFPDVPVIVGGPSVPIYTEHLRAFFQRNPQVDIAVLGEGEETFRELLLELVVGRGPEGVPGLAYRLGNGADFQETPRRKRLASFNDMASPYLDGLFDELLERGETRFTGAILETNRGCPYSCTFCCWGNNAKKMVLFDMDRIEAELDWIGRKGFSYLYVADSNFGLLRRDRDIADFILATKKAHGFPNYVGVCWAKNSSARILAIREVLERGGIRGAALTLSVQSWYEPTLEFIKRKNISLDEIRNLREQAYNTFQPTITNLILGLPGETYDSFKQGVLQGISPYPTNIFNVYPCLVLENSELGSPEHILRFGIQTRRCILTLGRGKKNHGQSSVPEYVDFVVATNTMPHMDWQASFKFGCLATVLNNFCLAHFLLHYLMIAERFPVDRLLEDLLRPDPGRPVFRGVITVLDQYIATILEGGETALPYPGIDFLVWEVDAVFMHIMENYNQFLAELQEATQQFVMCVAPERETAVPLWLRELCLFQSVIAPHWPPPPAREEHVFAYDWLTYYQNLAAGTKNELNLADTVIAFVRKDDGKEFDTVLSYCLDVLINGRYQENRIPTMMRLDPKQDNLM